MPATPERPFAADNPIPYRRSLRASRARRAAGRRSRLRSRGRRSLTVSVLALSLVSGGAFAAKSSPTRSSKQSVSSTVRAAQKALGIAADGIAGPQTRKAVRAFQRRKKLTVDGIIGPQTLRALGISGRSSSSATRRPAVREKRRSTAKATDVSGTLQALAQCESGGDPTIVSPSGRYRGKYQFSRATWKAMGGKGDPAAAPESVQDDMAAKLMARRGLAPWPACSRQIG